MILTLIILYFSLVFIVMEQIRSGELLHFAMQKKQEEKRKLKKLKEEQKPHPRDRNIESKFFIYILTLIFFGNAHDS